MAITDKTTLKLPIDNPDSPPRYKMALLTWAGAFPLLTAVNVLLGPLLGALPLAGRTLLMTGLLIGLLTYVIMPRVTRLCATWLSPLGVRGGPDETVVVAGELSRVHDPLAAHDVRCRTA
jgi:antibiotic biosynthesis monooxygenase (ABM) superfamily enzyme